MTDRYWTVPQVRDDRISVQLKSWKSIADLKEWIIETPSDEDSLGEMIRLDRWQRESHKDGACLHSTDDTPWDSSLFGDVLLSEAGCKVITEGMIHVCIAARRKRYYKNKQ